MTPPRWSVWLMERFGIHESVVGDLVEHRRTKPSAVWYWRQVAMAIVRAAWCDLGARLPSTLAAVAAGWAALLAAFGISSIFAGDRAGFWTVWLNVGPSPVVIWTHWWESMLDPRLAAACGVGFAMSGWLAARFRPTAMFAFAASVALWGLASAAVVFYGSTWHGLRWFAPYRDPATFLFQSTLYLLLVAIVLPLLVLVGGLAGASSRAST